MYVHTTKSQRREKHRRVGVERKPKTTSQRHRRGNAKTPAMTRKSLEKYGPGDEKQARNRNLPRAVKTGQERGYVLEMARVA